jgi:3-hydroxyisobutyrate dehydrogenase-like beta-hydroxyacid dehydrogenase
MEREHRRAREAADVPDLVIGLLHPGEMGAAVGGCLAEAGHPVRWASAGRGPATAARARQAGLSDVGTVAELAGQCDIILSVCPPQAAVEVARSVVGAAANPAGTAGLRGVFVDANAISPATSRAVARMIEAAGASYVDGGIIGPPPVSAGSTRLYLSGRRAGEIRDLFAGTRVDARIVDDSAGAASAVKMAYAAWTKGTAALLLAARALASAEGVQDALLAEWALSQPDLAQRTLGAARSAALKGWRWVAEMEEIADSMAAAGLPRGFHESAAEIFRRQPRAASAGEVTVEAVLTALLAGSQPGRDTT